MSATSPSPPTITIQAGGDSGAAPRTLALAEFVRELTPRRIDLLAWVHDNPDVSIYAVAQGLGRAYANVHADVTALVALGLLVAIQTHGGRESVVVRAAADTFPATIILGGRHAK